MSPTTTPSHLTTNPVTTTALITPLSRRSLSLSYHRPTTPVTTSTTQLAEDGNIDPRVNKKHIYIPCLCTKCLNHIEHKVEEVQYHLYRHGIDISYTKWTKHGEEDEPSISAPKPVNATTEFVDDMDFAYIPTDGPATVEMVNATKDNFDVDDLVKFQELLLDAEKPLYEGCPDFTKLSAIVKLLNLKGKYGASDKFFTELLRLIKKMLPAGNEMKDDKDLNACRTCGISRWKVYNKTHKVYENIPAKAWRTIDEKFPKIAKDPRNLRLGISADGVDVNTGNRHHSVWPVLTVIYNLPPWLCMKRKFIMLSVLISRYPGNDIDVFLEPLVDDLHTLFETGVDTYDASTKENFNLRAIMLWMINDYPALGTLCGCLYSGFKGCVVCGKDIHCVRLSASSKQSYAGHRRYLPYNHPFRRQKKAFNGQQEFQLAPNPLTKEQIYNAVQHIENKWGKGKRTNNKTLENQEDTRGRGGKIQKQKRKTTKEEEKNFCESLVGNLLNIPGKTKDGMNAQLDLAELGIKPELFARQEVECLIGSGRVGGKTKVVVLCRYEDNKTSLSPQDTSQNRNKPEGCIAEETIMEETIEFFSEYHKSMEPIGIPPDKHETYENEKGKPLSAKKTSEFFVELFQKAHLVM
ncbi:putative transposon, En/Spm-like protein [Tanacetum coccineum]